jgi:formylglycine-generating enzyme required for sulfatase activity
MIIFLFCFLLFTAWGESPPDLPEMVFIRGGAYATLRDESKDIASASAQIQDFWIGKYEITFEQFDTFCRETGYYKKRYNVDFPFGSYRKENKIEDLKKTYPRLSEEYGGDAGFWDKRPVVQVCWLDAMAYCVWLRQKTGLPFRLPTQVEWEYACTAGGEWNPGQNDLSLFAWYQQSLLYQKGDLEIHVVGLKKANPFGLYDILGNVWEWCLDGPADPPYPLNAALWEKYGGSLEPLDLKGGIQQSTRVPDPLKSFLDGRKTQRGGSFREQEDRVNARFRRYEPLNKNIHDLGFRVAYTAKETFKNIELPEDTGNLPRQNPISDISEDIDMRSLLEPSETPNPEPEEIKPEIKKEFEELLEKQKQKETSRLAEAEAKYKSLLDENAQKYPLVDFHKKRALLRNRLESENMVLAAKREDILTAHLDKKLYGEYKTIYDLYGDLAWDKEQIAGDATLQKLKEILIKTQSIDSEEFGKHIQNSKEKLSRLLAQTSVPENLLLYSRVTAPLNQYDHVLEDIIHKTEPNEASEKGNEIGEIFINLKNLNEARITKDAIDAFMR